MTPNRGPGAKPANLKATLAGPGSVFQGDSARGVPRAESADGGQPAFPIVLLSSMHLQTLICASGFLLNAWTLTDDLCRTLTTPLLRFRTASALDHGVSDVRAGACAWGHAAVYAVDELAPALFPRLV